jgi:hypothetical protein
MIRTKKNMMAIATAVSMMTLITISTTAVYAQTTNSTYNTLTSNPNTAQARITELEQQDPAFAYYRNTTGDCWKNFEYNLTATEKASVPSTIECSMTYQTAFDDYCSAGPTFHAEKCDIVKTDMNTYLVIQDATSFLSGLEYHDGTPYLGPDGTVNEPPPVLPPVLPPAGGNGVFEPQPPPRLPQAYTIGIDPDFAERVLQNSPPNAEVRITPLRIQVGDTVTWLNEDEDREAHTVTSGQNGQPDGKFDSGPIQSSLGTISTSKFEHTFTEAGEYPYFCSLHPNNAGTVIVS